MAKPKQAAKPAKKKSAGSTYILTILGLILVSLIVFAAPAFVLFLIGIVPAFVAAIIDREPGRNATIAVTATNLAGVAPFVVELLIAGPTMVRAMGMASDIFILATMYGAAAIGWVLVLGMPKVAAVYISVSNETRVQAMLREQSRLVEEWGAGIIDTPPVPRKKKKVAAAAA
ncbi:MAG: hypothetical protein ACKVJT_03375 [Alphaproteobacteria bacterium]|jgi:hypothetical protein